MAEGGVFWGGVGGGGGECGGVTCSICFNSVLTTKLLQCSGQHEFCITCLQEMVKVTDEEACIPCPICRMETVLPKYTSDPLQGLKGNFYGVLPCAFCLEDKAVTDIWWCSLCLKLMCSCCGLTNHSSLTDHPRLEKWTSKRPLMDAFQGLMSLHEQATASEMEARVAESDKTRKRIMEYFEKLTDFIMGEISEHNLISTPESRLAKTLQQTYNLPVGLDDPDQWDSSQSFGDSGSPTHSTPQKILSDKARKSFDSAEYKLELSRKSKQLAEMGLKLAGIPLQDGGEIRIDEEAKLDPMFSQKDLGLLIETPPEILVPSVISMIKTNRLVEFLPKSATSLPIRRGSRRSAEAEDIQTRRQEHSTFKQSGLSLNSPGQKSTAHQPWDFTVSQPSSQLVYKGRYLMLYDPSRIGLWHCDTGTSVRMVFCVVRDWLSVFVRATPVKNGVIALTMNRRTEKISLRFYARETPVLSHNWKIKKDVNCVYHYDLLDAPWKLLSPTAVCAKSGEDRIVIKSLGESHAEQALENLRFGDNQKLFLTALAVSPKGDKIVVLHANQGIVILTPADLPTTATTTPTLSQTLGSTSASSAFPSGSPPSPTEEMATHFSIIRLIRFKEQGEVLRGITDCQLVHQFQFNHKDPQVLVLKTPQGFVIIDTGIGAGKGKGKMKSYSFKDPDNSTRSTLISSVTEIVNQHSKNRGGSLWSIALVQPSNTGFKLIGPVIL